MEELWGKILPDPSVVEPAADFMWTEFPGFFTQKANGSFCQRSDEMPGRRKKASHTQGLVAKVEWRPVAGNGYSGIYETGSETVVMRLSELNNLYEGAIGHTPSIALKFLIDGTESENIFAQYNLLPAESWNFFHEEISNRLFNKEEFEGEEMQ